MARVEAGGGGGGGRRRAAARAGVVDAALVPPPEVGVGRRNQRRRWQRRFRSMLLLPVEVAAGVIVEVANHGVGFVCACCRERRRESIGSVSLFGCVGLGVCSYLGHVCRNSTLLNIAGSNPPPHGPRHCRPSQSHHQSHELPSQGQRRRRRVGSHCRRRRRRTRRGSDEDVVGRRPDREGVQVPAA